MVMIVLIGAVPGSSDAATLVLSDTAASGGHFADWLDTVDFMRDGMVEYECV